ncbi:MAG: carbohydrate ABC transporter permease [Pseudobdellovibrionaceae bacterium]
MPSVLLSTVQKQRVRTAWFLLLPMILVLLAVAGWPLLRTLYFSFTDANLSFLQEHTFVGLENYRYLWSDPDWRKAIINTFKFTFFSVSLETILGVIIALVLNAQWPVKGLLRTAIMVPWAIPTVVSAKMWSWMLNDIYGIINKILISIGIISAPIAWTADTDYSLWTIVVVDVWKTTPFMTLLSLAALQMIPQECLEAAKVDGIHPIKVFFKIILPLIRPALIVAILFRVLDAMRVFDLIYILSSGSQDTMSISIFARQQLVDFQDVGYGSAASVGVVMIITVVTGLGLWLSSNKKTMEVKI